ncbi:MAG: DUF192 domain-containing protein [Candidatus Omnitrophota bacterium]
MKIINQTKGEVIADKASVAKSLIDRTVGLLNRAKLMPGEGLIIQPCNSIHTFFMRFSIDVLFVDKDNRIIKIIPNFQPWRLSAVSWRSSYVIELPAGVIAATATADSDTLQII